MNDEQLSITMRDYLVNIYRLAEEKAPSEYVSTSDLADVLQVSAPAVNRMVTKLRDMALLHHERYQGITLTEAGEREARKQLRRQHIAEAFLVKVMGFGWHEVHHEAEQMSTGLDDRVLDRMTEMAGNPTTSPHGDPIPTADGSYQPIDDQPLANVPAEQTYEITRVMTRESDRLEYLAALGLTPGQTFDLIHAAPFNGPMQLHLGREYRIIGFNLAEVIRVRPATHADAQTP
jgi:DtxR family transcriptional regulator, Mn-dependent transcriptional regulator